MTVSSQTQPNRIVLIVGTVWPLRRHSAASGRSLSLVEEFLAQGYSVAYCSECTPEEGAAALAKMGVLVSQQAANSSDFDRFVRDVSPAAVIFDRFMTEEKFSWRVKQQCPDALLVLDTIDLHGLRRARQKALTSNVVNVSSLASVLQYDGDTVLRELAAILRSDLTLVTSDFELDFLINSCGIPAGLLQLCRLTYPTPPVPKPFDERHGFASIGSFRHPPNVDGVRWLRDAIWPRIRADLPHATMQVWGSFPAKEHFALSRPDLGFTVMGEAPDQFDVMRDCRVNLAPLRFGAGVKGKIADAWWCGTPTVTTPVGAEGMHHPLPFGGIIASTPEEFALAAIALYQDDSQWMDQSRAARQLITNLYSVAATTAESVTVLAAAAREVDRRRQQNITGQILWHQTARSTEYFSRWIEAKERSAKAAATPGQSETLRPQPTVN